jgi:CDP-diacylglycerol pyrophosphatase
MTRTLLNRAMHLFASLFSAGTILLISAAGGFILAKGSAPWYVEANELCIQAKKSIGVGLPCIGGRVQPGSMITDRMALWKMTDRLCLPMHRFTGLPFPCLEVDKERRFVVVSSPLREREDLLIVPTRKIEGIEDPILLKQETPNYWRLAWEERGRIKDAAGHAAGWGNLGMAVNSMDSRSQDQLHIHLGCVDPRLKQALARLELASRGNGISAHWSSLNVPWAGGEFLARSLSKAELDKNIFKLISEEVPGAKDAMGSQTIAVLGVLVAADESFVLLVNSKGAAAELLLGEKCG